MSFSMSLRSLRACKFGKKNYQKFSLFHKFFLLIFTKLLKDKDVLALTHLILIEATRDTTFDVSFGFKASPSPLSQFHGRIDCLLYQRYGGEDQGIPDLKHAPPANDYERGGIGFPLIPVFFPIQHSQDHTPFKEEVFPLTQIVSCGLWCLEHMSDVDPDIEYVRLLHTDGHRWKLYEVHRTHVKKTKFFEPQEGMRENNKGYTIM